MIVGSGLIAKELSRIQTYLEDDRIIFFASGVSNSTSCIESDFTREVNLLAQILSKNKNSRIFYFSSCTLNNIDIRNSPYFKHKLFVESLIKNHSEYMIFRVPQLVGKNSNTNTLTNSLYTKILNNELIEVWAKAERNLVDVSDLIDICSTIVKSNLLINTTVNIGNLYNVKIIEIIKVFESILDIKSNCIFLDKGDAIVVDHATLMKFFPETLHRFHSEDYLRKTLIKYYRS